MIRKMFTILCFILVTLVFSGSQAWAVDPNVDGHLNPSTEYPEENNSPLEGDFSWVYYKYVDGIGLFLLNDWCNSVELIELNTQVNEFEWKAREAGITEDYDWRLEIYSPNSVLNGDNFTCGIKVLRKPCDEPNSNYITLFSTQDSNFPNQNDFKYEIGWGPCTHTESDYGLGNHFMWELLIPEKYMHPIKPVGLIADAGGPYSAVDSESNGVPINLDGSGSEGLITSWEWTIDSNVVATTETAQIELQIGSYEVTLEVTDSKGTATDTTTIRIYGSGSAPIADAGDDQRLYDNNKNGFETYILDGSDSWDDGTIESWEWKIGETVIGTAQTLSHNFHLGTTYVDLKVTDDDGLTDTDQVVIMVYKTDAPVGACDPKWTLPADEYGYEALNSVFQTPGGLRNDPNYGGIPTIENVGYTSCE